MMNLKELENLLGGFDEFKLELIGGIARQFCQPSSIDISSKSNLLDQQKALIFLNFLMVHHSLTAEAFTKEKFEYALVSTFNKAGISSSKTKNRTNRGHDVTISGQKFSLKTQANKNISINKLHISKFMELGKGDWDFELLRGLFFEHMKSYDRILSLRCLKNQKDKAKYELVEIPKDLLAEAMSGEFFTCDASRQNPKPGYCKVFDEERKIKFELYFDAGSERKLQIKNINKENCILHCTWEFDIHSIFPEPEEEDLSLLSLLPS